MKAKKGDVVVLLAKGGEHYIKIKNECVSYEGDLTIAKSVLKKKRSRTKSKTEEVSYN